MFSARGVALNVTTASVQLRVLHTSVYVSAQLKLRGTNSMLWEIAIVMTVYLLLTMSVVTSIQKASFVHKLHPRGEAICSASM
jgi:hypothetical protein